VNKYGSRPVMIAGGCLSGCGLMAASFCNTVQELYLCIGVIGGELLLVLFCAVVCEQFIAFTFLFFSLKKLLSVIFKSLDKLT
jgi:uncharacterized membrane protein